MKLDKAEQKTQNQATGNYYRSELAINKMRKNNLFIRKLQNQSFKRARYFFGLTFFQNNIGQISIIRLRQPLLYIN